MLNASRPLRAPLAAKIILAAAAVGAVFSASACSSDTSPGGGGDAGPGTGGSTATGGASSGGASSGGASSGGKSSGGSSGSGGGTCTGKPSVGTNDADHCKADDGGTITQATGACEKDSDAAAPPPPEGDAGTGSDYGTTLYGTEGDDDDCKYHVKYTVPPICENAGVTFTATVTNTADGKPTTGAYPYLEATLDDLPSSSSTPQTYKETSPGVYTIGPLVFDRAGKWVTRFHFFEDCSDEPEDSPHGHVAFYIDVP
jgi:hypothetical protein